MYEICLNSIEAWKKLQPGDFFYNKRLSDAPEYMWEFRGLSDNKNILNYYRVDILTKHRMQPLLTVSLSATTVGGLYSKIRTISYKRIFMRKLNEKL